MKRVAACLALSLATTGAVGQSLEINRQRPAYDYELLASVPDAISEPADRKIVGEFLADKRLARDSFKQRATASCPEFVGGQIIVMEFAARLDREVVLMRDEVSAAYERMSDRLSSQGRSTLQRRPGFVTLMSADTKATAVAEVAPQVAESTFLQFCGATDGTVQSKVAPEE